MFDARTFPPSLHEARKILEAEGFILKGEYIIHDVIYSSKDLEQTLDKVFLRLRYVPVNIWGEKKVIVTIKNTELKGVGKKSHIPVKKQFDTQEEGKKFIEENYSKEFKFNYEFDRKGWQYDLGDNQVDLEDIEAYFSIEFKSPTEIGLKKLLDTFNVKDEDVIKGPSVVEIKKRLETLGFVT